MASRPNPSALLVSTLGIDLTVLAAQAQEQEWTGRQILDEVARRHETSYQYEEQIMTLIDRQGNEELREVRSYSRRGEEGRFKHLLVFLSPPGVKGVALLTWEQEPGQDDQWIYLPALGNQVKRIAEGSMRNYFMGTDFTYEDMVSESRDKFTYERLPDEPLDGIEHYVVKITPSDPQLAKESGYLHRVVWVRKDNFLLVRTDYFDRQGDLLKRQTVSDLVQAEADLWRGNTARMENFKDRHTTVIQIQKRLFEESAVPEENFRKRFLLSGRHVR